MPLCQGKATLILCPLGLVSNDPQSGQNKTQEPPNVGPGTCPWNSLVRLDSPCFCLTWG